MKSKLSTLLCLALTMGLMTTASAAPAYVTDPAQIKSYLVGSIAYLSEDGHIYTDRDEFTNNWLAEHADLLEPKVSGTVTTRIIVYGGTGFSEGLLPASLEQIDTSLPTGDNKESFSGFLNTSGDFINFTPTLYDQYGEEVDWYAIDYNKYRRFLPRTPYKEGVAWANWLLRESYNNYWNHQGFVDMTGKPVLDLGNSKFSFYCDLSDYPHPFSSELYPRFVNGYTIIGNNVAASLNKGIDGVYRLVSYVVGEVGYWSLERPADGEIFDEDNLPYDGSNEFYVIDTKGNVVETIYGVEALENHPLTRVALVTPSGVPYGYLLDLASGKNPSQGATEEQPLVTAPITPTYGQSSYKSLGYTIVGNVGHLNIEVSNPGEGVDTGDLFYVLYNKYSADSLRGASDGYVPGDFLRQIHYEVGPGETKILRVSVGQTGDIGRELTQEELDYGWQHNIGVEASRYILAQAETEAERDELVTLFKCLHFFGEMSLDYQPDKDGVTILAAPGGSAGETERLNEKFAAFTAQF